MELVHVALCALEVNSQPQQKQKGLQVHGPDEYLEPKWLRYRKSDSFDRLRYVLWVKEGKQRSSAGASASSVLESKL